MKRMQYERRNNLNKNRNSFQIANLNKIYRNI